MMPQKITEFTFPSHTGECDIFCRISQPEENVRAVVQLAHGMAEHIDRYGDFAAFLNESGIAFAANDHAGHGRSLKDEAHQGYFAPENGWTAAVEDLRTLRATVKDRFPGVPHILMGHSMGSFMARTYASRYPDDMDALIISGTAGRNPVLGIAKVIAKYERKKNGPMVPSKTLDKLAFGAYNKQFQPSRTDFDWLSRDEKHVDEYVQDPLCGFPFTAEAFLDLFTGLGEISAKDWAQKVPDVPILMIAGDCDPVGSNGKGVKEVEKKLLETGHRVKLILYPGGRHEMLNELNYRDVYRDILDFLNTVID